MSSLILVTMLSTTDMAWAQVAAPDADAPDADADDADADDADADDADADDKKLRPLSTDRPDVTESPKTVDRGHFQAEIEFARYTVDEGISRFSFVHSNLKFGLTDFWDIQLVVESLVGVEEPASYNWGFGDIVIRNKFNIFGNDEGNVALGIMPWIKAPTAGTRGNGNVEGGGIVLLGVDLPAGFTTGYMIESDARRNELDDGYHWELLTTATIGHPIVGPLSAYIEVFGTYSSEPATDYALGVDGGLTYLITPLVQLDAGIAGGLTEAADDLSIFTGISFKI